MALQYLDIQTTLINMGTEGNLIDRNLVKDIKLRTLITAMHIHLTWLYIFSH